MSLVSFKEKGRMKKRIKEKPEKGSVPSKKRRGRFSSFEKVGEVCWKGKT